MPSNAFTNRKPKLILNYLQLNKRKSQENKHLFYINNVSNTFFYINNVSNTFFYINNLSNTFYINNVSNTFFLT